MFVIVASLLAGFCFHIVYIQSNIGLLVVEKRRNAFFLMDKSTFQGTNKN
jgi:hypothetical protein